jgi:hypothetical protein
MPGSVEKPGCLVSPPDSLYSPSLWGDLLRRLGVSPRTSLISSTTPETGA